jgi:hypothetical protein
MTDDELSKQQLFARIEQWLLFIFPTKPDHRPAWNNGSYKPQLFQIFRESYIEGRRVRGDEIWTHLQNEWSEYQRLSDEDRDKLSRICAAWGEWLYACERMIV